MKKINVIICLFAAACFFQSCGGNDTSTTTTGSTDANNTTGTKSTTDSTRMATDTSANARNTTSTAAPDKETTDFATKAASGGMLEVKLGQLAQQKAKNPRVKNFGEMMVADHSKANDELKSLAAKNNITLPTSLLADHQKHLDMMSKMSGADFDKHYIGMMVDDHKEDISDFKKESTNTKNDAFKNFAGNTLPVLQKHLDSAQAIHSSMK